VSLLTERGGFMIWNNEKSMEKWRLWDRKHLGRNKVKDATFKNSISARSVDSALNSTQMIFIALEGVLISVGCSIFPEAHHWKLVGRFFNFPFDLLKENPASLRLLRIPEFLVDLERVRGL
jgi:hypothetical protein